MSVVGLTNLSLVRFSILWKLDELLGEHAGTIAKDVAFKFNIRVGPNKLQNDGITGGVDSNLHILSSYCEEREIIFDLC